MNADIHMFINGVVVPALVDRFLAEREATHQSQKDIQQRRTKRREPERRGMARGLEVDRAVEARPIGEHLTIS